VNAPKTYEISIKRGNEPNPPKENPQSQVLLGRGEGGKGLRPQKFNPVAKHEIFWRRENVFSNRFGKEEVRKSSAAVGKEKKHKPTITNREETLNSRGEIRKPLVRERRGWPYRLRSAYPGKGQALLLQ